ncbi:MAG: sugar phosphate isomerase/epimerase family protein, partial [Anaerolineae bacterium]
WGGDVHVPHGDEIRARTVRQITLDAGIKMPSYGSYYRVGHGEPIAFEAIVETAVALGAPLIRVWAGKQGSEEADATYWDKVVNDSRRIAGLAEQAGLSVAYEFHRNTLTDTYASAQKLLERVDHPAVKTYWQQPSGKTIAQNLEGIDDILPWLTNIHVNNSRATDEGKMERLPLAAASDAWRQYLEKVATTNRTHHAMIEFVRDNTPEQFLEDAKTLKEWAAPYAPPVP